MAIFHVQAKHRATTAHRSWYGASLHDETYVCPACGLPIPQDAKKCLGCGSDLLWDQKDFVAKEHQTHG
jgi:hypothetical protein